MLRRTRFMLLGLWCQWTEVKLWAELHSLGSRLPSPSRFSFLQRVTCELPSWNRKVVHSSKLNDPFQRASALEKLL